MYSNIQSNNSDRVHNYDFHCYVGSLNRHLNFSNSLLNEKQIQFQVGGTFGEAVVP